jgi:hypothetical protein
MAVYVDDMRAPHGRLIMCHMIADSTEELLEMVRRLKLQPHWIQSKGTYREHFDISMNKRRKAIELGAVPITQRELGYKLMERRKKNDCLVK